MYGADWCPDVIRAKDFMNEKDIPFQFVDTDLDEKAKSFVEEINNGKCIIPTITINGNAFTNPGNNIIIQAINGSNKT